MPACARNFLTTSLASSSISEVVGLAMTTADTCPSMMSRASAASAVVRALASTLAAAAGLAVLVCGAGLLIAAPVWALGVPVGRPLGAATRAPDAPMVACTGWPPPIFTAPPLVV